MKSGSRHKLVCVLYKIILVTFVKNARAVPFIHRLIDLMNIQFFFATSLKSAPKRNSLQLLE